MYYNNIPKELQDLPLWSTHKNKRPVVKPNGWAQAKSFEEVISTDPDNIGIIVAPAEVCPYVFIDVDYPDDAFPPKKEIQPTLMQLAQENPDFIGSDEHLKYLEPVFDSIAATPLAHAISNTYTEFSPSLTGLHLVFRMAPEEKTAYGGRSACKKATVFKGQCDFQNTFLTITGMLLPYSTESIDTVTAADLEFSFGKGKKKVTTNEPEITYDEPIIAKYEDIADVKLPSLAKITDALNSLPIDGSSRIRTAWSSVTGREYEHYDFWLTMGMALHNYAQVSRNNSSTYLLYLEWSEKDIESFTSEEDVSNKWESFSELNKDCKITWKTLLKVASLCSFDYPKPIMLKGKPTANPIIHEWDNFKHLLDFYNIELFEGEGYYIRGSEAIIKRYFDKDDVTLRLNGIYGPFDVRDLEASMLILCQASKWKGLATVTNHVKTWISRSTKKLDLFKEWLDTPFEDLPYNMRYRKVGDQMVELSTYDDNSTFDYVYKCLNTKPPEHLPEAKGLYKRMVRATLMQAIKFREDIDAEMDGNGGMLILLGAENTYKSTFCKTLVPHGLPSQRYEINMALKGDKAMRDFNRVLSNKFMVQLDEFEGFIDQKGQGGSQFKALLSNNDVGGTEIYQTSHKSKARKAIIIATSNEMRQVLSDNGSRRMWFVIVGKIDTKAMLRINLHTLYNNMRKEFRKEFAQGMLPWLLDDNEIKTLYQANEHHEAKNDLAYDLDELFDTSALAPQGYLKGASIQKNDDPRLMTLSQVISTLEFNGLSNIKRPGLVRALEKFCGRYTQTWGKDPKICAVALEYLKDGESASSWVLANGQVMSGANGMGKYKYNRWVMPPSKKVNIPTDEDKMA